MYNAVITFLKGAYEGLYTKENNHIEDVVVIITYSDGSKNEIAATRSGLYEIEEGKVPQPIPFDGYR